MYEKYTRQSLPDRTYRELLGSAICVFNSNNSFIIENILRCDDSKKYDWYHLIDLTSGNLKNSVRNIITSRCGDEIENLFDRLVKMRNRIIHSFQITDENGEQLLATKELATKEKEANRQYHITVDRLLEFITLNEKLSDLLHNFRGY